MGVYMANIFDYLDWRKDVPFSVSPFNEVDSLVLSELVYADLAGAVPEDGQQVTLSEARTQFWQRHTREEVMAEDSYTKMAPFLMDGMTEGARFADTKLAYFYSAVDPAADVQLAAVTFYLPDGTAFVAFRGTDSTIVGWKEDFYLSFLPETEGQRRAVAYMNEHFLDQTMPLRLGGHSKGGNLAVYAAVKADESIRRRILAVYSNDGPGFLESFTQSEAYKDMLPRIISTVPEDTVIGTLLTSGAFQHVLKSSAAGIVQHDGFSWQVLGPHFVEAEKRSTASILTETTLRQWLRELSEEKRRQFVNSLFSLLEATGASTFDQIKQDKLGAIMSMKKMISSMPREQRESVWNALMELLKAGSDNVMQETIKTLKTKLETVASALGQDKKPEGQDA